MLFVNFSADFATICYLDIRMHSKLFIFSEFSDPNTLVESVSFVSQNRLQPFMVSITTSSVLLMDFHCHLTKQEVCGYLGGTWENNTQSMKCRYFSKVIKIILNSLFICSIGDNTCISGSKHASRSSFRNRN